MIKRLLTACLALVLLTPSSPAAQPPADAARLQAVIRAMHDANDPAVLVFAHRCLHRIEPENSVAAVKASIAAGVHGVEIDVRKSADGTFVIMHDATVNRTTNGTGKVSALTLAQLKQLQLHHGTVPTADRVPTLDEMLDAAKGHIMINLDPKDAPLPETAKACRAKGMIDQIVFKQEWSKLTPADIAWIRQQSDMYFMPIVFSTKELAAARAAGHWPAIEFVSRKGGEPALLNPALLKEVQQSGTRVWINMLENGGIALGTHLSDDRAVLAPQETYTDVVNMHVGVIQTDIPELAMQTLDDQHHGLTP